MNRDRGWPCIADGGEKVTSGWNCGGRGLRGITGLADEELLCKALDKS